MSTDQEQKVVKLNAINLSFFFISLLHILASFSVCVVSIATKMQMSPKSTSSILKF